MKKKTNSSQVVTAPVLRKELKRVKKELKQELTEHVDKRIDMAERVLRLEIVASTLDARQRLEKTISDATDKVLTRIDPFVKEVRDSHEESAIVAHQVAKLRDRVDNHEEQLRQLKL